MLDLLSRNYILLTENILGLDESFHRFLIKEYLLDEQDKIKVSHVKNNGLVVYFDDNGFNHEKMIDDLRLTLLP